MVVPALGFPDAPAGLPAWPLGTWWPSMVPNSWGAEDPARMTDENVLHLPAPVESDGRSSAAPEAARPAARLGGALHFQEAFGFCLLFGGLLLGHCLVYRSFFFLFFLKKPMFTLPSLNYFLKKAKDVDDKDASS